MPEWSFVEQATNQLMRPRPGDSKAPSLWPSEASATYINKHGKEVTAGKCRRQLFYRYLLDCYSWDEKYSFWKPVVDELKTQSKPVDKYMLWIWASGEQAEAYLIEQAKRSGVFVNEQVPVYIKSHNVSGKKDIEVVNPETGKLSIVEAKSVYGFGSNATLGTESQRRKGSMGTPKESNLMQIAIYHWWHASQDSAYEESRLLYIARDTGRYAEYLVRTVEENNITYIEYRPWHPYKGPWIRAPYTIDDILKTYQDTLNAVETGDIPPKDFQLVWDEDRLEQAFQNEELGKIDTKKHSDFKERQKYNALAQEVQNRLSEENVDLVALITFVYENTILLEDTEPLTSLLTSWAETEVEKEKVSLKKKILKILNSIKPKKEIKPLIKGDWQCKFCKFSPVCYPNIEIIEEED
jgi:hypothetical protein